MRRNTQNLEIQKKITDFYRSVDPLTEDDKTYYNNAAKINFLKTPSVADFTHKMLRK